MTAHVRCPVCQITQEIDVALLGELGQLRWFRCRYCGMQWSHPVTATRKVVL